MGKRFIPRPTMKDELKNYFMITVGLTLYAFTWKFFMAPFKFVTGGITGVGGIVEYTTGIPMQYTYFFINIVLIIIAIQQLGWKFCVKTIYAIALMTLMLQFFDFVFELFQKRGCYIAFFFAVFLPRTDNFVLVLELQHHVYTQFDYWLTVFVVGGFFTFCRVYPTIDAPKIFTVENKIVNNKKPFVRALRSKIIP